MFDVTPSQRDAIRASLKRADITHKALAEQMKVSEATITKWLAGDIVSKRLDAAIPAFVDGVILGMQRAA